MKAVFQSDDPGSFRYHFRMLVVLNFLKTLIILIKNHISDKKEEYD
jgi:hypothetical protein